eukprot:7347262-Prorocentrum_lima.AAC.1
MTSSLVGSEMCIRDRPRLLFFEAMADLAQARAVPLAPPKETMLLSASPCLLYTSDAADDM